jgi:hypothetical protein
MAGVVRSQFVKTRKGATQGLGNLLEFCRLGELNEVLGPVALGDEWLRGGALAGLRRCLLRARARARHRKKRNRPMKNTRVSGELIVERPKESPNKQKGGARGDIALLLLLLFSFPRRVVARTSGDSAAICSSVRCQFEVAKWGCV